jgi:hypothetical protein
LLPVTALFALAGCGGSATPMTQTFTYADRGRVVTLAMGRRATVRLDTPNWTFDPISGGAVRAVGPQRLVYVTKRCGAVNGCGYVELTIETVARGRSVVGAHRMTCGEAFRCPPDLRKFAVSVIVH